jgi:hypothetical protein
METKESVTARVFELLLKVGYEPRTISHEFRTASGGSVDLMIRRDDGTLALVEAKTSGKIAHPANPIDLRFDPAARNAQYLAREIGARYYGISDGRQLLWFETDSEGRPRLLPELDLTQSTGKPPTVTSTLTREQVTAVLLKLTDIARTHTSDPELYTLLAVYVHLVFRQRFPNQEWSGQREFAAIWGKLNLWEELNLDDVLQQKTAKHVDFLGEALWLLSQLPLVQLRASDFLFALDTALRPVTVSLSFRLPRWLVDFIVQLAQPNERDDILDIYANSGDTVAALLLVNSQVSRVHSLAQNPHSYLWTKVQQLVLRADKRYSVALVERSPDIKQALSGLQNFAKVVVCPPFGDRVRPDKTMRSEQAYLELALAHVRPGGRVVAILPETVLTSQRYKNLRSRVLSDFTLTAIIGLDSGLSDTAVKMSILVIDNVTRSDSSSTALAIVRPTELSHSREPISWTNIPQLREIVEQVTGISVSARSTTVRSRVLTQDLDANDLSVARYDSAGYRQIRSVYPIVQLADYAHMRKGSGLTLDPLGDLLVIGPGAVRKLSIRATKLGKTAGTKLPSSPVIAGEDDIVINAVGEYRGQAALVGKDFAGFYISRNVIVLASVSPHLLPAYLAIAVNTKF